MKRIFIGIALFVTMAASVFAASNNDLTPLAVIKLNKSETITLKQLKARVEFLRKETGVQDLTVEQKKQVLEALVSEKLVAQAAAKDGIAISDSQVDAAFLNTFSQQLGQQVTESQLSDLIQRQTGKSLGVYMQEQTGMSLTEYKEYLKNQLVAQQYVYAKKQEELKKVSATDDEIRQAFEMNKSSFVWNDMMKLFLVIVPKGTDAAAAKKKTNALLSQYKGGKGAEEKIKTSSENGTVYQAGYMLIGKTAAQAQQLGWSYDKVLELFGNKKGFVSELSETDTDYQFYAIMDKYSAKMLSISDIIEPESTVTVYDFIKERLTQQKQSQFLATAAQDIAKSLTTSSNVDRKKSGSALDKLMEGW